MLLRPLFIVALLGGLCIAAGSKPAVHAPQPPDQATRTIDVRQLLIPISDWTDPPNVGEIAGEPAPPSLTPEQMATRLLDSIRMELGAENAAAKVEIRDGRLIATGTEAQLDLISGAIADLKKQRFVEINVEVRFVTCMQSAIDKLPQSLRRKVAQAPFGPQALEKEERTPLMEALRDGNADVQALTAPSITVFNQQKAFVQVMTNQFYEADYNRNAEGKWQPVIGTTWSGIHLNVRAAATSDGSSVSAAINGAMQRILGFDEIPKEGTDLVKKAPKVERIEFDRIAVGQELVLLDAQRMSLAPVDQGRDAQEGANDNRPQMLLVLVQLTVPYVRQDAATPATRQ